MGTWSGGEVCTLVVDVGVVVTLKIVASCLIVAICSVPRDRKGDNGAGLRRATVSSRAAAVAASTDDVAGMGAEWWKNLTYREVLLAWVLGM